MTDDIFLKNARSIGQLMRRRRLDLGLDQASVAARAGVSRQWVSEVERGKSSAELGLVLRVLAVLDLQLVARARNEELSPPSSTTEPPRARS